MRELGQRMSIPQSLFGIGDRLWLLCSIKNESKDMEKIEKVQEIGHQSNGCENFM